MDEPAATAVELAQKVETLEVKVAFQDHLLAQLDEVIQGLRDQLDQLTEAHDETRAQVTALAPEPENTKPPHY